VVCKILELHSSGKPYLVLCDYHEDVVILDDEIDPDSADFYQIKTLKDSYWTLTILMSRPRAKKGRTPSSSILGKLHSSYLMAPKFTNALHFVSNAHYDIPLRKGGKGLASQLFSSRDISRATIKKIKECLSKESGSCSLPTKPVLFFEVTALSLLDHSGHTKGKVEEFLEQISPNQKHYVSAAYRVLSDEVARKTTHEGQLSEYLELAGRKGIGRTTVSRLLNSFCSTDLDEYWKEAFLRLTHEGLAPMRLRAIRRSWELYEVDRMDPNNETLHRLRDEVRNLCADIIKENQEVGLVELSSRVASSVQGMRSTLMYSQEYIASIAMVETYENFPFPKTHSELKEEA
jgi:hypothetical protein